MISGSYFGEIELINNKLRYYNAICESKSCELFYISKSVK